MCLCHCVPSFNLFTFSDFPEVFVEFFDAGEIEFVAVVAAVEVAGVFLVSAADAWPVMVYITEVFRREELTACGNINIPVTLLHKDRDALMGQVPADIVIVALGGRCFNRQCQIPAAQSGTLFT